MKKLFNKADEITRRDIIKYILQSSLALNFVSTIANANSKRVLPGGGKAKSVIYVNLAGGMSHVDTLDIKEANKDAMMGSGPIKSSADGIRVSKHLPNLAKQMHHCAIINSMTSHQGNHEAGQYLIRTGYEKRGTVIHPELGAWVKKLSKNISGDIPSFVKAGIGGSGDGFFGSKFAALPVPKADKGLQNIKRSKGVSAEHFDKRLAFMNEFNQHFEKKVKTTSTDSYNYMYETAVNLMNSKDLEVFNIHKESQATKEAYGENGFGQSCLLARRLVEKGVRFIEVTYGGWDHHYDIYDYIGEHAAPMDQSVAALLADLSARGLLDSTLVVFNSEFGRGAKIDERGGRGHHPLAFSSFLAGAGIQGGQKYGKTDSIGHRVVENPVTIPSFNATIAYAMGLPLDHVEKSPTGRPFTIANKRPLKIGNQRIPTKPLTGLF